MEILKRKIKKVVDNQGDTSLAHLEATLELSDKIDELKEAIQSIPETVIPEPKELPEYPTKMEMSLTGISVVTLKGDTGEKGDKGDKGDPGEKGKDGKNGLNGKGIDGRDGLDGKDGENGKDGSPDTAEQVRDKLETLEGEDRLKRSAIQGGEKLVDQENLDRAISILDQRTQYLINKTPTNTGTNLSLTTTGTSGPATLTGSVLNIPEYSVGSGGITRSVLSISSPTTAGATASTDYVYLVSGTTTLTLPTAVGNTNRYTVKNVGSGDVTIDTTSAQTIDGGATAILTASLQGSIDLISDNSNWFVC